MSIGKAAALMAAVGMIAGSGGLAGPIVEPGRTVQTPAARRQARPRVTGVSMSTAIHLFGDVTRRTRVRAIVRKYPNVSLAMEAHPWLENVKVLEVPLVRVQRVDNNKYDGSDLRKIREKKRDRIAAQTGVDLKYRR